MQSSNFSDILRPYQERLKTPANHGGTLICPALRPEILKPVELSFHQLELSQLRERARKELLQLAQDYSLQLMPDSLTDRVLDGSCPLVVTGHQPELFHSGVWFKNFLTSEIARHSNGIGVNLVIDSDRLKYPAVLLPGNVERHFDKSVVPFDASHYGTAWESAFINDQKRFDAFPKAVASQLSQHCAHQPLVTKLWDAIAKVSQRNKCSSLPCLLTAGRMSLERQAGVRNLELPMSRLTESTSFLLFFGTLLGQADEFAATYNNCLNDYRRRHQLAAPHRPVPNLQIDDDYIELPFWSVDSHSGVRDTLCLKHNATVLTDNTGRFTIPLQNNATPDAICAALKAFYSSHPYRIRTKALTTTLFARLFFADLFIHGIGGSIYDEVTDNLIEAFYGIPAPIFLAASGTWHLPFRNPVNETPQTYDWEQTLHQLQWNPEQVIAENQFNQQTHAVLEQKAKLIESHQRLVQQYGSKSLIPLQTRREEYERFSNYRTQMLQLTKPHRLHYHAQQQHSQRTEHQRRLQTSREYSYCLFPESLPDELAQSARMAFQS